MLPPSRLMRVADLVIPWVVGLFLILVAVDESDGSAPIVVGSAVVLAVVQGAALRWRRSHPERVMAVVLVAGLGYLLLIPEAVLPVAGFFALGSLASARPPRVSLVGLAALLSTSAVNFVTATVEDAVFTTAFIVAVWALGEAARSRRLAIAEAARRAVGEEQARIARELHDVIAHSVSVIIVQAAAAEDVFERRPDQARAALGSIERSARDALGELRRLLGAVRPGPEESAGAPRPGLDALDALAAPLHAGGLTVEVHREGEATPLPAGVDLSAYRIVQEALTNTVRHARASRADVTVRYRPDALEIDVRDDGVAPPRNSGGQGHGLIGMGERAALLGGVVEAGPAPGGGYRVHARLPLGTSR